MRSAASGLVTGAAGLALGASLACAAAACGNFSATDPSPSVDGSTDATDATDASSAPADGGADAPGADAGCTAKRACGCVVGATFCADFEGTTVVEEWEVKTEENGGILSFGASDRSAPNALHAATSPLSADGGAFALTAKALVSKTFFDDISKISLSFDMAAPSAPCAMNSDATYFVSLTPADAVGSAAFLQTKSGPMFFVKGNPNEYTPLKPFTNTKTWTHVTMEAMDGMFVVSYDGAPAANPIPFATTSSSFVLAIGLTNEPAATACTVSYDNVVLRVAP
jgi:hypothetical protein